MLGESVRRRQRSGRSAQGKPGSRGPRSKWRPLMLVVPVALVLPFVIGYLIAVYLMFPPPPAETAGTGIAVPNLVGSSATDAQRALAAAGLGDLLVTELPHPTAAAGQVIAQSPLPGQQLRGGAAVRVALSAGRPQAVTPDVYGYSADRAESMLQRAGFEVQRLDEESTLAAGRVIRTEPSSGQVLGLPAVITLVVSSGPPLPEPDTMPPDTLATAG
jgi:eukaryotic-like serine/threonine-protein kinase